MLIEIKPDIFENSDFKDLRYLLQIAAYKHRYNVFVDLAKISNLDSYKRLDSDDKAWLEQEYNRVINNSISPQYSITEKDNPNYFDLEEGIRFLNQKISIFLENSLNDGYFLDSLLKNFKKKSKKILRYKSNGWLEYEMGGGTTINNAINSKLKSFSALKKQNYNYIRCFVLIDSDRKFPTMPLPKDKNNLIKFLEKNRISFHILEKREIENYLPDETFKTIKDNDAYINAYLALTPKQKDFIDVQYGFSKNINSLSKDIQNLYNNIPPDSTPLRTKTLEYTDFKAEFPKLFLHEATTQKTLLARTSHQNNPNELQDIIDKITKLL